VVFLSNGTDLVTNAVNSQFHAYVRDMQSGVTLLASADPSGQALEPWAWRRMISPTAGVVGFDSPSDSLVPGDLNNASDAFHPERRSHVCEAHLDRHPDLLAVTANGRSTMGPSPFSANGRLLVFQSLASDLVPRRYQRPDGRLCAGPGGWDERPDQCQPFGTVSTNGASRSRRSALMGVTCLHEHERGPGGQRHQPREDVFVRDLETGTTTQVSVGMAGSTPNGASTAASISPDGRWVAIQSQANNLAAGDTDTSDDIFVRGPE